MLKKYADLNLAKLRDEAGLDFAHYTYTGGRCSCCYGPHDLPAIYWKGKTRAEKVANKEYCKTHREYDYILFKNAANGSGQVKKDDYICLWSDDYSRSYQRDVYVEWNISTDEKLDKVCKLLQEQLGEDYKVIKPESIYKCIEIKYIGKMPDEV